MPRKLSHKTKFRTIPVKSDMQMMYEILCAVQKALVQMQDQLDNVSYEVQNAKCNCDGK